MSLLCNFTLPRGFLKIKQFEYTRMGDQPQAAYNTTMWFIYIILCRDHSLYTGITNNLEKRLAAHLKGTASAYTISHKPLRIVYTEVVGTKSEALKRELEIKSWPRSKKISNLGLSIKKSPGVSPG